MVDKPVPVIHRFLRELQSTQRSCDLPDRELLRSFAERHDEVAFEVLLRRHGPMVWRACQRVLRNYHDCEDAFQATFLVLARKAAAVSWQQSIGTWLYEVAHRLALEMKLRMARSRARDTQVSSRPVPDPLAEITGRELLAVFDEELLHLPEKYRAPLVLCCLEGSTGDQAARRLGCSPSTLRRRLAGARELLHRRLVRRGVVLSTAALSATLLTESAALAKVPLELTRFTLKMISLCASGKPIGGVVSSQAAALAEGVMQTMFFTKLKYAAILVLTLSLLAVGAGALVRQAVAGRPDEPAQQAAKPGAQDVSPPKAASDTPARKDLLGDPLPAGAFARLGTSRLRGEYCYFLPDSKRLVRGQPGYTALEIFDAVTGKALVTIRATDVPGRQAIIATTLGFTRDSKYLAAVCWEGRCGIWETDTGRLVRWLDSPRFYSIVQCDFSPDGKYLAVGNRASEKVGDDFAVGLYEVESGRLLFSTSGTNSVFAPDGRSLTAWDGYPPPPGKSQMVRRLEVPTGKTLSAFPFSFRWTHENMPPSDGVWAYAYDGKSGIRVWDVAKGQLAFTLPLAKPLLPLGDLLKDAQLPGCQLKLDETPPELRHVAGRRELMAAPAASPTIRCWSLDTGTELWRTTLAAPAATALSEDGTTFVTSDAAGNVQVWDAASGKQRASFHPRSIGHCVTNHYAPVMVSPDGSKVVTASDWSFSGALALWDAKTGALLTKLPGHRSEITACCFSPDSATIYTIGRDKTLRAWHSADGRERFHVPVEWAAYLACAPDGAQLFAADPESGTVRVVQTRTGQETRHFAVNLSPIAGLALAAGGKQLVVAGHSRANDQQVVQIVDATSGAVLREFSASGDLLEQLAARPDGAVLATSDSSQHVALWQTDGKKLSVQTGLGKRQTNLPQKSMCRIGSLTLSPDGKWLAYSDQEQGIVLVDVRAGKEAGRIIPDVFYQHGAPRADLRDVLAFSPDSKMLAWSGIESTADIFLFEVRTRQLRARLPGDNKPVKQLVFAPNGAALLSAGPDGAALLWDMLGRTQADAGSAPSQIALWWQALADTDAAKAYPAMRALAAHADAALTLLNEKLSPAKALDPEAFAALLARLNAQAFRDRKAAADEVIGWGEAAEPHVRGALHQRLNADLTRSLEDILQRLEPGRLRSQRAIEVLEMMGSPGALATLRKLAVGLPESEQTIDATQALARASRTKRVASH